MKHAIRLLLLPCLIALLLCASALGEGCFPAGVLEIPQGTQLTIDDEAGEVTLYQPEVVPQVGDTFVVYLQDLPIGYVAERVTLQGERAVIAVHKADKSVYRQLSEEGTVTLTQEMYAFVPAANSSVEIGEHLKFEDGQVIVKVKPTVGTEISVGLSNLRLDHAISSGEIEVSLSGNYEIGTGFSIDEDELERELELGELRIYGVGKIALSIDLTCEASLQSVFRGYFRVGVSCDEDGNRLIKGFDVSDSAIEGKGRVNLALKLTAGVDVLVAEADLFAEIGVATQVETQFRSHLEEDPPFSTHCEDYSFFLFSKVGAEAKYLSALGETKKIAAADFDLWDEEHTPFLIRVHFENGDRVDGCTEGMEPSILNIDYNGKITDPGGMTFIDRGNRALETEVSLAYDATVDGDYTIAAGGLDLAGHTLTVNGDLIIEDGYLQFHGGTLIVHGSLRLQRQGSDGWGDSDAYLDMGWAEDRAYIDGDVILQSNASNHSFYWGVLSIGGSLIQRNTANPGRDLPYEGLNVVFSVGGSHSIQLENPEAVFFSRIGLEGDVNAQSSLHIGNLTAGGHRLSTSGDLYLTGSVALAGGEVSAQGSLYHSHGEISLGGGKLHLGGNYYGASLDSDYSQGWQGLKDGNGVLRMEQAADEMRVDGSFLTRNILPHVMTAGTLYVGGDFRQVAPEYWAANYFVAERDHTTVLNGAGIQRISFADPGCGFGTLKASNSKLVFEDNVSWLSLGSDLHGAFDAALRNRDIDLNGWTLAAEGDLHIRSNLDLHGGTLTVAGDLYHEEGEIAVDGGQLLISGSYSNIGIGDAPETLGEGRLRMSREADEVRVGGSFITRSRFPHAELLTAGVLYVAGDLLQETDRVFETGPRHQTVLNGTGQQRVAFEAADSALGILESRNENLVFANYVGWMSLASDLHAVSEGAVFARYDRSLSGHRLTVDGDLRLEGDIHLDGGVLAVNGSLWHHSGRLCFEGGKLLVSGAYRSVGTGSLPGERPTQGSGSLEMMNPADEMRVGGDFILATDRLQGEMIRAGVTYIGGNFTQFGEDSRPYGNFPDDDIHRTVLNSTGRQTVLFENPENRFCVLELTQPRSNYTFIPEPCWITLIEAEVPVFGTPDFILPEALTAIEASAFEGVQATVVLIPDRCHSIGSYAFRNAALAQIRIPTGCAIGTDAFEGCERVTIFGTAGSPAEAYCESHDNCIFVAE